MRYHRMTWQKKTASRDRLIGVPDKWEDVLDVYASIKTGDQGSMRKEATSGGKESHVSRATIQMKWSPTASSMEQGDRLMFRGSAYELMRVTNVDGDNRLLECEARIRK